MNTILALFLAFKFGVTEQTIGYFFAYVGTISFVTRAAFLGKLVDRFGEPHLSRIGMVFLAAGLAGMALAPNIPLLAVAVALVPLGAAFTFPVSPACCHAWCPRTSADSTWACNRLSAVWAG